MNCPYCGAQWQLPHGDFALLKKCPFCQRNLCDPNQNLATIEDVLKEITFRYGIEVLQNGDELLSLFSEIAPSLSKEKAFLQFFVECGGHKQLSKLQAVTATEQKIIYHEQIEYMTRIVNETCRNFLSALNLQSELDNITQPGLKYEYKVFEDDTIELTLCKSPLEEEVAFPEKVNGKQVVSIAGTIFGTSKLKDSDRNKVKSIIVPEGVSSIGAGAFYGCKSLSSISLPNSLDHIGDYAFRSCKALSNILLPPNLSRIGKGVFSGSNLSNIALPDGITHIPPEAFKNCKQLTQILFPDSLKFIEEEAFSGCRSIESLTLPQNLECIGQKAFQECKCLSKISLPIGIRTIDYDAFADCEALITINLPNSISLMEGGVFSRCFNLIDVHLPDALTIIEGDLFDRCYSLSSICVPEGVTSVESGAFYMCEKLKDITIPASVSYIAKDAFSYCKGLTVHCRQDSYAYTYATKKKWKIDLL